MTRTTIIRFLFKHKLYGNISPTMFIIYGMHKLVFFWTKKLNIELRKHHSTFINNRVTTTYSSIPTPV